MIPNLPTSISIVFGLTTLATLLLFQGAIKESSLKTIRNRSGLILVGLVGWLLIQATLTLQHFYNTNLVAFPPKILLLGILPPLLISIICLATPSGRRFMDSLPLVPITYLHIVRIPVELVLLWLFMNKAVPELMTMEGRNFDILSGITAPFVAYFGLKKGTFSRSFVLAWNVVCLALLGNIVANALLAAPFPTQKFAFDQPNIAILYFPFSWLPTFIVPIVLFGHLVSIRQLTRRVA